MIEHYSVPQDFNSYEDADHETWRLILNSLLFELEDNCALDFEKAIHQVGLTLNRIPTLFEINRSLAKLGWRSIVVAGFLPPQVFMTLHANAVLPITGSIRTPEQRIYTPIPDIVHEAIGHLPFLVNANYRRFLTRLGKLGAGILHTPLDMRGFKLQKAIAEHLARREGPLKIKNMQTELEDVKNAQAKELSPATRLARFHWWTVEYGLFGESALPYGAGIISSVAELRQVALVRHERLSLACVEVPYQIDTMQPQLYVAESWEHLHSVLSELESSIA